MSIRLESRPHKGRRALIGLAVLLAVGFALNYTIIFDRFWFSPPTKDGQLLPAFQLNGRPDSATLRMPTLGKEAPVIFTKSEDGKEIKRDLEQGVSLASFSPRPGEPGNVFLTGHSNNWPWTGPYRSIFGNLDELKEGDTLTIDWDRRYTYRVQSQKVVGSKDVWVTVSDPTKRQLTLMTCWPPSTTWKRRVVTAQLVE